MKKSFSFWRRGRGDFFFQKIDFCREGGLLREIYGEGLSYMEELMIIPCPGRGHFLNIFPNNLNTVNMNTVYLFPNNHDEIFTCRLSPDQNYGFIHGVKS